MLDVFIVAGLLVVSFFIVAVVAYLDRPSPENYFSPKYGVMPCVDCGCIKCCCHCVAEDSD